jgi:hypothetical protein
MARSRSIITMLIIVIYFIAISSTVDVFGQKDEARQAHQTAGETGMQVKLFAAYHTTSWDARDPAQVRFELPVLYLHQNRVMTDDSDRTLEIKITGLSSGEEIELEIVSRHEDVTSCTQHTETQRVFLPDRPCTSEYPCVVRWTFDPQTTPSDFYTLQVRDSVGHVLWQNPYDDRPDLVILDTWDVNLDDYTVRILYATLFPFARGHIDLANRLAPAAVTDFIEGQFIPIITDTWHTQFDTWGLGIPIHHAWDDDNVVEIIVTDDPFALFDNHGTRSRFIGDDNQPTLECRIWWASSNNSFQAYKSLVEAVRAVYAHEFFHLVQRNILLFSEHPDHRWNNVFIEAQGKFAPSVQHPDLEVRWPRVRPIELSEYLTAANRFLSQRLNSSYSDMEDDRVNKYDAALYWRFLYEQYGDMDVIRTALLEMTRGYSDNIVPAIQTVMNQTFAQHEGPFDSFADSLIAFARANYALRLPDGHCHEADFTKCGGTYYDPGDRYVTPALEVELNYAGTPVVYEGAIPASFGMDFVEINLDSSVRNEAVQITLDGNSDVAQFSVQAWTIAKAVPGDFAMTADPTQITKREDGVFGYVFENVDTTQDLKLALIITRLDAGELLDTNGYYTVTVGIPEE